MLAINDSIPVKTAEEGYYKVNEAINADFAFIHDAAEIKYQIARNCNYTQVGEVFAEQPYALAIQQGSHIHVSIISFIVSSTDSYSILTGFVTGRIKSTYYRVTTREIF